MPLPHEERDRVERGGDGAVVSGAVVDGVVEVVKVGFAGGEVDVHGLGAFGNDRLDEEAGAADEELVVESEGVGVGRVRVVMRADDRCAGHGRFAESGVPCGKEAVAETECLRDDTGIRFPDEIGLAAAGVDVRMGAHEGVKDARLIPSRQQLLARIAEETADVGTGKRVAGDILR